MIWWNELWRTKTHLKIRLFRKCFGPPFHTSHRNKLFKVFLNFPCTLFQIRRKLCMLRIGCHHFLKSSVKPTHQIKFNIEYFKKNQTIKPEPFNFVWWKSATLKLKENVKRHRELKLASILWCLYSKLRNKYFFDCHVSVCFGFIFGGSGGRSLQLSLSDAIRWYHTPFPMQADFQISSTKCWLQGFECYVYWNSVGLLQPWSPALYVFRVWHIIIINEPKKAYSVA